ncbi:MAG: xanthine dehydrogenase accessory protein XdhC [Pseudomonadales bacterium]|nr:xanthine dehydrogenase accessory protein XdhC [Pseudomonadales bacterium]
MLETSCPWYEAVQFLSDCGESYVLVTVLGVKGSAPRDSGTKMVVTKDYIYATIGGGHLEYKSTLIARDLLAGGEQDQHIEHFVLGASLGQCCGGSVSVLYEKFAAKKIDIMLFGAGHVGRSLVNILGELPCQLTWVDSREDYLPKTTPNNTKTIYSEYPQEEVSTMPAGSYYVVMTHNHQIDLEICASILQHQQSEYVGLIGSESKWRRFQTKLKQRLVHAKLPESLIENITCPVGLSEVKGKQPMEVAVSIAGEIINHYQSTTSKQKGVTWAKAKGISEKLLVQEIIGTGIGQ